jgi:hypothetical protein
MFKEYATAIMALAFIDLAYLFGHLNQRPVELAFVSTGGYIALTSGVLASALYAVRRYGFGVRDNLQKSVLMISLGFTFWLLGIILGSLTVFHGGFTVLFPSWLDALWLTGYTLLICGFYAYDKMFQIIWSYSKGRFKYAMRSAPPAVFFSITYLSLYFVNPLKGLESSYATATLELTYLVLDALASGFAVFNMILFFKGRLGKAWTLISSAMLIGTSSTTIFFYLYNHGRYYRGHPVELLSFLSLVLIALGMRMHVKEFS